MNKIKLKKIEFILYFKYSFCLKYDYPYNPNIHNLGNTGFWGSIHAKITPKFISYSDKNLYGFNLRQSVLTRFDKSKSILDFGCGTGFSTNCNNISLGIDTSLQMINEAKKIFPNKKFEIGHAEYFKSMNKYDLVTCMFLLHEVPKVNRKNIIDNAISLAKEKIIILDIASNYNPSKFMINGEPYLEDYLNNIDNELENFKKIIIKENHIHLWVLEL